ncbi:MAG: recombination mediator RecR [Patescibacteria group bacterium]
MRLPKPISKLIDAFERLPGIGPKTAQRLVFHLLNFPQEELENFAEALINLKKGTVFCSICKTVDDKDPCSICSDSRRNSRQIVVVSSPLDVLAFEKTGYKGMYHVLHGVINPLNNIGPDEIFIQDLLDRLKDFFGDAHNDFLDVALNSDIQVEVILATNTSMEGESTAMYISKLINDSGYADKVKITRIARGLPVGGDIEYADDITLSRALEGRSNF